MVMRQAGNYRLLLNAKVYSGMAVQKMTGDVGVTFACANAASALEPSTPSTVSLGLTCEWLASLVPWQRSGNYIIAHSSFFCAG